MNRWLFFVPLVLGLVVFFGLLGLPKQIPVGTAKPTILLYNHIVTPSDHGTTFEAQYPRVTTRQFAQQLAYLRDHHAQFLPYYGNLPEITSQLPVLLVFADGTSDFYTNAWPLLAQYDAQATVFIDQNKIGQEGYLTQEQIATLLAHHITVAPRNYALLAIPQYRQEVSGAIALPQFIDLLPNQYLTGIGWAVVLAVLAGGLAVAAMMWPVQTLIALCFFIPTYLIRFRLFGIPATLLELAILAVLVGIWSRHGRYIVRHVLSFPYRFQTLLFVLVACASAFFAHDRMAALGGLKALVIEPVLLAATIYGLWQTKPVSLRWWLYALSGIGSVVALIALTAFFQGHFYVTQQLEHLTTFFGNPNYLASFLLIGLVLAIYLFLFGNQRERLFGSISTVLIAPTFVLARSDTAIAALAITICFLLAARFHRRFRAPPLSPYAIPLIGILAALAVFGSLITKQGGDFVESHHLATLVSRHSIYSTSILLTRQSPLTGVGLLNYNQAYVAAVSPDSPEQNVALSHNTLLDFSSQMGMLGLLAYVWLVIRFIRFSLASRTNPVSIALFAVMAAVLIHGMFDSQYHKNDYAVIFWILIALSAIMVKTTPTPSSSRRS